MVLSRVDERLEEVADLLSDIVAEDNNINSIKRLCINVASFQSDSTLEDQEKTEFLIHFQRLVEKKCTK